MDKSILYMNLINLLILRARTILLIVSYSIVLISLNIFIKINVIFQLIPTVIFIGYLKNRVKMIARKRLAKLKRTHLDSGRLPDSGIYLNSIGLSVSDLKSIKAEIKTEGEAVLAEIDQDGFYLFKFPMTLNVPTSDETRFLKRHKYNIKLVALPSGLAIKKDYKGNYITFANEVMALSKLSKFSNAPALLKIDFDGFIIYMSYIPGTTLRDMIAREGGKVLDKDKLNIGKKHNASGNKKWLINISEGRKYIHMILDQSTISYIYNKVDEIHSYGICLYDVKYGNIMIEEYTKEPFFIDFENCVIFDKPQGFFFNCLREYDLFLLNLHLK